jgi:hypothetical protein
MISQAASSAAVRPLSRATAFAFLALVVCCASLAEAGVQNVPCRRPFIFPDAAVNVVVLPYESAPGLSTVGGMGVRLSGLLQLEVLRSIAKFGSVGAVQMVGTPAECDPEVVAAKLLGQAPGAATTLRKGHGLVVVWGRFYLEGGDVFVQTFCRLLRSGIDETFDLVAGGQPFSGQLSSQAFACAPRKVTVEDIRNFEQQFARSTIVRSAPEDGASGVPMVPEPLPYWISDTRGDWMKIDSQGGVRGWIRLSGARDAWSLARWLPELAYVEGMVGYLRCRIAAQQASSARAAWVDAATGALSEYERGSQSQPSSPGGAVPPLPWRTALAGAVQMQLRGVLSAMKPDATTDDRVNAMTLFERAAAMLPHDANARNLVAMMQLSLTLGSGYPGLSPKQAAADLLQALGADPGNPRLLANLQSAYQALLSQPVTTTPILTEDERRVFSEQLAAINRIR